MTATTPTTMTLAESLGRQFLGRGVNMFTMTCNSAPDKSSVVVVADGTFTNDPIRNNSLNILQGESFTEFTQRLAVEAGLEGSYLGITASVESKFGKAYTQSVDTKFGVA
ncbi:MAG: hypothetical protein OHK0047_02180 [Leptolyngbyaceae cyanobacterium]